MCLKKDTPPFPSPSNVNECASRSVCYKIIHKSFTKKYSEIFAFIWPKYEHRCNMTPHWEGLHSLIPGKTSPTIFTETQTCERLISCIPHSHYMISLSFRGKISWSAKLKMKLFCSIRLRYICRRTYKSQNSILTVVEI